MKEQQLPQSDHDLLIRIDERLERVELWSTNHTEHHFRRELAAWISVGGLVVALILALLRG